VVVNVARSPEEAEKQARGEEIVREEEVTLEDELVAELGAATRE
jgi:large subunit ribosomal protein L9